MLDDIRIYNQALSQADVTTLYNNGLSGIDVMPDVTPPAISAVTSTVTGGTATITWTTDKSSTSVVNYGPTTSYGTGELTPPIANNALEKEIRYSDLNFLSAVNSI
jgi:hypothetical protein